MNKLKAINVDVVAKAIGADAGGPLPGLRESLAEAKAGRFAAVHTPAVTEARRKRGRPVGTLQATTKR